MYAVSYKKPGALFWRKIKNVIGDGTYYFEDRNRDQKPMPLRWIQLSDQTRIELPMTVLMKFSPARFEEIREQMSKEAGQQVDAGGKKRK